MKNAFLALILTTAAVLPLRAASVSHEAVYLTNRDRSTAITVANSGTRSEEIRISFAFGFPQSDESGRIDVPLQHEAVTDPSSAVGWLQAFPRRFVLEPGTRQTVRIMATPSVDLPQGEYWARLLVSSRGGQAPIEQKQGDVNFQIDLETVIVSAVTYRNGEVTTGLAVPHASATQADDALEVTVDLTRTGNAAYLGTMRLEVTTPAGDVTLLEEPVAVYRSLRRVWKVPVPSAGLPENATLRYTFTSARPDLPTGAALPALPVSGGIPIQH